jgi:hypothetical protein
MLPRTTDTSVPTEPTLGSWSLTALALLLVIGGILGLFSSNDGNGTVDHGQLAGRPPAPAKPAK